MGTPWYQYNSPMAVGGQMNLVSGRLQDGLVQCASGHRIIDDQHLWAALLLEFLAQRARRAGRAGPVEQPGQAQDQCDGAVGPVNAAHQMGDGLQARAGRLDQYLLFGQ